MASQTKDESTTIEGDDEEEDYMSDKFLAGLDQSTGKVPPSHCVCGNARMCLHDCDRKLRWRWIHSMRSTALLTKSAAPPWR